MRYIERTIEQTIRNVSMTFPVLLVTGPRQVGKSTLLNRLCEQDRKIVSLDNPTIRALAKTDPELFLQRYSPPVLIDEVQYAPELFPYIKIMVDEKKMVGDFWLTGSQMFRMMKHVTESLAGRAGIVPMLGLSNSEIQRQPFNAFTLEEKNLYYRFENAKSMTVLEVFERIYKGSMPRLYELDSINQNIFFESYLDTYLSRDVRELGQIADMTTFTKFIRVVAARTGTILNYEQIANEVGITSPTSKKWLSILVSSGIILLVQPYFNNSIKRIIKSPRIYFLDTGLCAHLMGWGSAEVLENSMNSGEFFETWVVSEIYKSYLNVGERPPLYYYRDSNKKEIDLIIEKNGRIHPIEIKKGAAPQRATKHFSVLNSIRSDASQSKTIVGTGAVICMSSDILPIDRNNWMVPAWII